MDLLLAVAGAIIVLGGAGAVLVKVGRWMISTLRKAARLVDDLVGEPARPGQPERPGLMQRLATIERRQIEHGQRLDLLEQLRPNGGQTVADQVAEIRAAVVDDGSS